MEHLKVAAEWCAVAIEAVGVAIIVLYSLIALGWALVTAARRSGGIQVFKTLRHSLARGILLGLEFLVAADIIHTVVIDLTLRAVTVLAIVVLIRTFLSFSLEVEMTGRWPWRQGSEG